MKNIVLIVLLLSIVGLAAAQNNPIQRELVPARGHYKQLAEFSPKPKSPNEEIDKKKFITDAETITRRMSLKPTYLTNVTVDDFKIPDVPANSSDQTKAEIEYLLALQKHRTKEDVRASLFYADVYYSLRVKPGDPTYATFRRNLFHIGRSIGSWFNPDDMPVTADFMARVWQDASYFTWSLKFKYARIRPVVIDPRIKNLQETDWAAYPSGRCVKLLHQRLHLPGTRAGVHRCFYKRCIRHGTFQGDHWSTLSKRLRIGEDLRATIRQYAFSKRKFSCRF